MGRRISSDTDALPGAVTHWADLRERGSYSGMAILAFIYRWFGRVPCLVAMAPIVTYFYATGTTARRASLDFLRRVAVIKGWGYVPNHWHALRHFFAFGEASLDKFAAWFGGVRRGEIEDFTADLIERARADPRGACVISAHLGNIELIRALVTMEGRRRVNVIVHTAHAASFNRLIERFAPNSPVRLIQALDVGVATAIQLSEATERGEWVVLMGDRISVRHAERAMTVNFLGAPAAFPQGPFMLAAALRCPTYLLLCVKDKGRQHLKFASLGDGSPLPRADRTAALRTRIEKYAALLEQAVLATPYQWFNFYDFWAPSPPEQSLRSKGGD